jgi:hypothetical protein
MGRAKKPNPYKPTDVLYFQIPGETEHCRIERYTDGSVMVTGSERSLAPMTVPTTPWRRRLRPSRSAALCGYLIHMPSDQKHRLRQDTTLEWLMASEAG